MAKAQNTKETAAKDARKQELSGKGMSRVEIARAAWEKAQADADLKKARLDAAIEAEKTRKPKEEEDLKAKAERAAKALERAGMPELAAKAREEAGIEA